MFSRFMSPIQRQLIGWSVFFATVLNVAFLYKVAGLIQFSRVSDWLFMLSIPIFLAAAMWLVLQLLVWPYIGKLVLAVLLFCSASASYSIWFYNVQFDSDMVRNVLESNSRELGDLLTVKYMLTLLVLGVLPIVFLFAKQKWQWQGVFVELRSKLVAAVLSVTVVALVAVVGYEHYASFFRTHQPQGLNRQINPFSYLQGVASYSKKALRANRPFAVLDKSPMLQPHWAKEPPLVMIMVLGETARAANFSLLGYPRLTNPLLAQQADVVGFANVSSCGTATARSLPCMFSNLTRAGFDESAVNNRQNVLDIITLAGVNVLWRDNDDGCKGVCDRVPTEQLYASKNPKYCKSGEGCYDEILLDGLEAKLKNIRQDTLIVLHTMGSHGPTYYKRYPKAFEQFTPTCDTADLPSCTQAQIVNTYDNTIVYTDYVLNSVIETLKRYPQFASAMLYLSDHGESLGENNMYLHGLPYSIAPSTQTQVPLLVWLSKTIQHSEQHNVACLNKLAQTGGFSHDNLFHSLLGIMEVNSPLYHAQLDMFKQCGETAL